jgi:HemY protein
MRRIVWLLLIVSAAVGIALLMRVSHGNIAVFWPPYRIDMSVNLAALIIAVLFILLHLLFNVLSNALNLPGRVREYRDRRRRERALLGLRDSVLAYFEGRFGRAERLARGALSDRSLAGSAALIGARAAQRLHETGRRDRWIESARGDSEVDGALRATLAEIALEEQRPADALAAISDAKVRGVRHLHGMRLTMRAHEQMGNWKEALETLRQLERRDGIDPVQARLVRVRALRALFEKAGDDPQAVLDLLDDLPAPEREIDEVEQVAARALLHGGRHQMAARLIDRAMSQRFDAELVTLWPDLTDLPARDRLARAEGWLQRWGEQPSLLLALGRLCAAEELWGKAEEFFLRAERQRPDPVTRTLLGRMCERLDRSEDAARWYREAALLALGEDPVAPIQAESLPALPPGDPREGEGREPAEGVSRAVAPLPGP